MLCYAPSYLSRRSADALLAWLLQPEHWRQETVTLFGRCHPVPRLVGWYGDAGLDYRYAGASHPTSGWPPRLRRLRARLQEELATGFNFVLLNRYRGGGDRMGWHRDDERGLATLVASLSLGAPRRFQVELPEGERRTLVLEHGSLLCLDGRWRHCLPATRRPVDERVNLTFRRLETPP